MRYNKIVFGIVFSVLLLLGTAACSGGEETQENNEGVNEGANEGTPQSIEFTELDRSELGEDKVVAVYEGGEVRGSDFADYLAFRAFMNPNLDINGSESRQGLVKDYVFAQDFADKTKVTDEVQEQADGIWEQLNMVYDEETRQQGYEKLGTSEEQVKESLVSYLATEAAAQEFFRGQITEDEVTQRYNDDEVQEQITMADVRHILISTHQPKEDGTLEEVRPEAEAKEMVDDLYNQLQEGADFAELATEHTEDPGSKENGGLYAGVPVSQWAPEFKQASLEQEINEIGQPVKTMYGYHIIRVEDRSVMPLEEVREPLLNELAGQKFMTYYEETLPELIKEINI